LTAQLQEEAPAMAVAAPTFTGFRPEAIEFLVDLKANNERSWFQPRKGEYERLLKQPLEALMVALEERFRARGIPLRADPAKSPFRIYRDVRFSKDKSPYKTNVGASLPWAEDSSGDVGSATASGHASGGYFHLEPGEIFVGGGVWHPEKSWLDAFRTRVDRDPDAVRAVFEAPAFVALFGPISGDSLQRVPAGYPADHPQATLLKLKDVTFGRHLSDADAMGPGLPDVICDTFEAALPAMRFLAGVAG
jgi:uncharacterized protein (TIGR02453 family)